jgi:hypothetical protein
MNSGQMDPTVAEPTKGDAMTYQQLRTLGLAGFVVLGFAVHFLVASAGV